MNVFVEWKPHRCLPLGVLIFFLGHQALADVPSTEEILAKTREYLGGEEALSQVRSLHYEGRFETSGGAEGEIEIIFQKPLFQRVQIARDDLVEVTALTRNEGWRKVTHRDDPSRWSLEFLNARQVRELQASTWESLNFFKGIEERRGGRIENRGLVEVEGEGECVELVFHHPGNINYTRYISPETGRIILSITSGGNRIVEEGESFVSGIRFPLSWTMYEGDGEYNRIHFDEISVNEEFDEEIFEVPSLAR